MFQPTKIIIVLTEFIFCRHDVFVYCIHLRGQELINRSLYSLYMSKFFIHFEPYKK